MPIFCPILSILRIRGVLLYYYSMAPSKELLTHYRAYARKYDQTLAGLKEVQHRVDIMHVEHVRLLGHFIDQARDEERRRSDTD